MKICFFLLRDRRCRKKLQRDVDFSLDADECGWARVESVETYLDRSLIKIAAKNFLNRTVN